MVRITYVREDSGCEIRAFGVRCALPRRRAEARPQPRMARCTSSIMAGGGGTRLRPLSTARSGPKPFLPLLRRARRSSRRRSGRLRGDELGAGGRVRGGPAAYAPLVRCPGPRRDRAHRARRAATPRPRSRSRRVAVDRPDDDVMVVLPADHRIDPDREGLFREVLRAAADAARRRARSGSSGRSSRSAIQPTCPATRVRLSRAAPRCGRAARRARRVSARGVRGEADARAREALLASPGVAWNAGMFLWRRRVDPGGARAVYAPDVARGSRASASRRGTWVHAYATINPVSIDYAVMESGAPRRARS